MSDLKQAVERLRELVGEKCHHDTLGFKVKCIDCDLRLVLSALSRAEAERDLLAAECRAWRVLEHDERNSNEAALTAACAATDAAGVLEGK